MGKYLWTAFVGLLAVVVIVLVLRWLGVWSTDMSRVTDEHKPEAVLENVSSPDIVTLTIGDSLYHKPDCSWIGSSSRRTTLKNAVSMGFHPCPYCIGSDDESATADDDN